MYDERRWLLRNPILWIIYPIVTVALVYGWQEPGARWFLPVPIALLALMATSNLGIRVEGDTLQLAYFPLWRRTIPLSDIEAAEVVPYKWWRYGGWGIRFGLDGSISYSVWEKQAVRLTLKGGKRPVNVGSGRPHELRAALLRNRR